LFCLYFRVSFIQLEVHPLEDGTDSSVVFCVRDLVVVGGDISTGIVE